MNWFERITGFVEDDHASTQARLKTDNGRLVNVATGRSWSMGRLQVVSLARLRQVAQPGPASATMALGALCGDIRELHRLPQQQGALIQVASQANLLEMVHPDVTPEDGITGYVADMTQGPACAIAAGAGTVYRNYLVPLAGGLGQDARRQINTLAALGTALGKDGTAPWTWRNGYALATAAGLTWVRQRLAASTNEEIERLRGLVHVGVHWDVEVTDAPQHAGQTVSQVYCSALPVAYGLPQPYEWQPLAQLVLEAAYEATLLAGVLNARRGASRRVLLTRLGGGAFGNDPRWIEAAIRRALACVRADALEVSMVLR